MVAVSSPASTDDRLRAVTFLTSRLDRDQLREFNRRVPEIKHPLWSAILDQQDFILGVLSDRRQPPLRDKSTPVVSRRVESEGCHQQSSKWSR